MLNVAIISGRLTREPELRTTQSGTPVTNFSVAVDRDRPDADGTRATDFIDVVAWRQLAEFIARYFVKGQPITVQGRLQRRSWTDKTGAARYILEIQAEGAWFAGDAPKAGVKAEDFAELDGDDEGLPF